MIIFLHGPDSFRSRKKLNALIEQFKKTRDPRGDNVVLLDGEKLNLDELNSKMASQSLLAEKRMVIVSGLFNNKEENLFASFLEYFKKQEKEKNKNVVIFHESIELDSSKYGAKKLTVKRKKLFEYLAKQEFSQKFNQQNNLQTANWIKKEAAAKNISISQPVAGIFSALAGNNLWQINNDLNKIINFVQGEKRNEINEYDIRRFIRGNIDENIFALTDSISNRNKASFFSLLEQQLEAGASIQQILTMTIRQFKIIIQIKELLFKNKNAGEIASELKLHPFVVKKTTPQTRNFSMEQLKKILSGLIEIDYKIKTGRADGLTSLNILFAN
ncbi:MAG: DNA polymerase III subunit delta [Patescibacteria group bacterium]|jgi:DNA polymerase-3 subunit delta